VRARSFSYLPGEKVWLFQPKIPVKVSRKLIEQFEGSYFVIQQTSPSNYIIAPCETKKQIGYTVEACAEVKIHTRHRPVKIIELRPRPVPVKNVQSNSVPVPAP